MLKQRAPTRTEVAAALAANRQAGFDLAARTPTHRMLAQAVNQVFQRWLDGDPIDPDEVRALEVQVLAAGRWCKETDGGIDRWADIRAERVALLRRIREHCGTNTTHRKFRSDDTPQIAPKKIGLRGLSHAANLALATQAIPANTRGSARPTRRGLQNGGFQEPWAVQRFATEVNVTEDTAAIARRALQERKTFAFRIRLAREEHRWTQKQMSEALGISDKELNRAEHAHTWGRPPSMQTRVDFAVRLGKARDWFVPEVEADDRLEGLTPEEEASL